jgi:hypothetical protein
MLVSRHGQRQVLEFHFMQDGHLGGSMAISSDMCSGNVIVRELQAYIMGLVATAVAKNPHAMSPKVPMLYMNRPRLSWRNMDRYTDPDMTTHEAGYQSMEDDLPEYMYQTNKDMELTRMVMTTSEEA